MKKLFAIYIALFTISASSQLKLMTYNLRYANPMDAENYWELRKEEVGQLIKFYDPDIFGAQEVLHSQLEDLTAALPEYQHVGVGRDDGKQEGEYAPIFFKDAKYKLIRTYTYWLSETPETPSIGWDAATIRIVTFAILKDRVTREHIAVFNTHFDYKGDVARMKSAELILELLNEQQWGEIPVVVMGDFNSVPDSAPIALLSSKLNNAHETTLTKPYGPEGTYSRFNTELPPTKRVDYIFTKNLDVLNYRHIDDRRLNGLWVSDHLPVFVTVRGEQ